MPGVFIWAALLSAALVGIATTINKSTISNHITDDRAYTILSSVVMLGGAFVVAIVMPITLSPEPRILGAFIASGVLFTIPSYLYFRALNQYDATAVSTLTGTEAIAMPLFAFIFIGERLDLSGYLGVILVASGVIFVGVVRDTETGSLKLNRAVFLILGAVALWSAQDTILNTVLPQTNYYTAFFWTRVFGFLSALVFLENSSVRTEVGAVLRQPQKKQGHYLIVAESVSAIAMFLLLLAYAYGPMSLASPLAATYPIFTLVFVGLAHRRGISIDSRTNRSTVMKKVLAACLTVIGVLLIS